MKARFHKRFIKDYQKLDLRVRSILEKRLKLFIGNPYHIRLSNHPLKGKRSGYRSINITGDIRAIYKEISNEEVVFVAIGSHGQLYG